MIGAVLLGILCVWTGVATMYAWRFRRIAKASIALANDWQKLSEIQGKDIKDVTRTLDVAMENGRRLQDFLIKHDDLLGRHNELLSKYNVLADKHKDLQVQHIDLLKKGLSNDRTRP